MLPSLISPGYSFQEKKIHHEEHKEHEGEKRNLMFSIAWHNDLLRALRFFVVLFS